jgi:hypothetical protein
MGVKGLGLKALWQIQILVELAFEHAQRSRAQFCPLKHA